MKRVSFAIFFVVVTLACANDRPKHCTQLMKESDYPYNFAYDFDIYMPPGTRYKYIPLKCINPPTVSRALVMACDWVAPPLVQFTAGDYYLLVERQDINRTYSGTAVISISQYCGH